MTIEKLSEKMIPKLESALMTTYSSASIWQIDGVRKLSVVINTFGSFKLSEVSLICWSHGYMVQDVVISCVSSGEEGEGDSYTNVVIFIEAV